ncbi:MAG: DNA-binding protein WhiA [Clostridiales bacterium]|nr:DNA-binding protein WhiA [Clostridiales bacterium]
MSFSSEIKARLCGAEFVCSDCAASEFCALIGFAGHEESGAMGFNTENEAVARRAGDNAKSLTGQEVKIKKNTKNYHIELFKLPQKQKPKHKCCRKAYVRGAFLGGGSVNSPEKDCHLEFATKHEDSARELAAILEHDGFLPKLTSRKGYTIVYFKDRDSIADLLGYMGEGAGGLMMFEKQIEKQVRNDINRLVNCENANTNKLAKAASRQIYAVEKIQKANRWSELPEVLQEIGNLRCKYPEDSLKELGEKLSPPIGKSGVNHRLNRIIEFAKDL